MSRPGTCWLTAGAEPVFGALLDPLGTEAARWIASRAASAGNVSESANKTASPRPGVVAVARLSGWAIRGRLRVAQVRDFNLPHGNETIKHDAAVRQLKVPAH